VRCDRERAKPLAARNEPRYKSGRASLAEQLFFLRVRGSWRRRVFELPKERKEKAELEFFEKDAINKYVV